MIKEYRCRCGQAYDDGEYCYETMTLDKAVVVEFMPGWLRGSCRNAESWGMYPHNGAQRVLCCELCALDVIENDADEYDHIVSATESEKLRVFEAYADDDEMDDTND